MRLRLRSTICCTSGAQKLRPTSAEVARRGTYAPPGAPAAAVTAALPEQLGAERNRDYRYTWVRDESLSMRVQW